MSLLVFLTCIRVGNAHESALLVPVTSYDLRYIRVKQLLVKVYRYSY